MDIIVSPGALSGQINIIPSKSQAHRLLICAAFADRPTTLLCPETSRDMEATADCLQALGANIQHTGTAYEVTPIGKLPDSAVLPCGESGSTLRFLLPVAGALGVDTTFLIEGRLPLRPLSPLWEEMERMGCRLSRPSDSTIRCQGRLQGGKYRIDGGISSQFITGLLLALSLLPEKSALTINGKTESKPYIELTKHAMGLFGIDCDDLGGQKFISPGTVTVEGDWSNGAFFAVANFLGSDSSICGLSEDSVQGDRMVVDILRDMKKGHTSVSAADIPDLVPVLSLAACRHGAIFTDIARLRLKESDRVASVCAMITALGGKAEADENTLTIYPCRLTGGTVDSFNDHRIAMSAAIAATVTTGPVTILGAECASKSYPRFWAEFARLGGNYEQCVR